MPTNFWEMVAEAEQVCKDLRAQGIKPTQEAVERETARRRRSSYQQ